MGSGKSTLGPILAAQLGWRFRDTDEFIESVYGMRIADIFALHGEPYFRNIEREAIAKLTAEDGLVLALGGGAIEDEATCRLLLSPNSGTLLLHLEISLKTTLLRCKGTESVRPVLADTSHLAERYQRRLPLYRQAHHTLVTDALNIEETIEAILKKI